MSDIEQQNEIIRNLTQQVQDLENELDAADELRRLAQEVIDSVPASYDGCDPYVIRHAKALNALNAFLRPADGAPEKQA